MNEIRRSNALSISRFRNRFLTAGLALVASIGLGLPAAGQNPPPSHASYDEEVEGAYSYFRVVEGQATLFLGEAGHQGESEREPVEVNRPILTGDRIWVEPDARLEIVLSDYNLLRLDGETEVRFEQLANSPEAEADFTNLNLSQGALLLDVVEAAQGRELPRIETVGATIFVQDYGSYRLAADRGGWLRLTVREGVAEVLTRQGSSLVRRGEEAVLEGEVGARLALYQAGALSPLERWAEALEREAYDSDVRYVDEDLRYAASGLDDYGDWVTVEGSHAWRPRHGADWRPYSKGRWQYTPRGYTWISYEPWGWVPYHYGTWDYVINVGWVWFPGRVFAPAHVYWYWNDSYVAWFPRGYYDRYYHRHGWGHRPWGSSHFTFALHGYGGGSWNVFASWNFCPTRYFGHRRQVDHVVTGHRVREVTGWRELPRGVVTSNTGGLPRRVAERPSDAVEIFRDRQRQGGDRLSRLDVTPFLERDGKLPNDLRQELEVRRLDAERVDNQKPVRRGRVESPTADLRKPAGDRAGRLVETPAASQGVQRPAERPAERPTRTIDRDYISREVLRGRDSGEPPRSRAIERPEQRTGERATERPSPSQPSSRVERPTVTRPSEPERTERPTTRIERPTVTRPSEPERTERPTTRIERPTVSQPEVSRPSQPTPRVETRTQRPTVTRPEVSRPSQPTPRVETRTQRPTVTRPEVSRPSQPTPRVERPSVSRPSPSRPSPPSQTRSAPSSRAGSVSRPAERPSQPRQQPSAGAGSSGNREQAARSGSSSRGQEPQKRQEPQRKQRKQRDGG